MADDDHGEAGPAQCFEQAQLVLTRFDATDAEDEIARLKEWAEKEPDHRGVREKEIAQEQYLIDLLSLAFPDEETRRVPGFNIHEWREQERNRRERRAEWRKLAKG